MSDDPGQGGTIKSFLQVRLEGGREVTRNLRHYRLEAILAVGFRVNPVLRTDLQLVMGGSSWPPSSCARPFM